MNGKVLCPSCAHGKHTNPQNGSYACQCDDRRCACYGMQVRMGVRKDRTQP